MQILFFENTQEDEVDCRSMFSRFESTKEDEEAFVERISMFRGARNFDAHDFSV